MSDTSSDAEFEELQRQLTTSAKREAEAASQVTRSLVPQPPWPSSIGVSITASVYQRSHSLVVRILPVQDGVVTLLQIRIAACQLQDDYVILRQTDFICNCAGCSLTPSGALAVLGEGAPAAGRGI